jgi:phosphoribosylformylglycinamidine cyclo-ligase
VKYDEEDRKRPVRDTMKKRPVTYRSAGVDIARGNALIDLIRPVVRSTFRKEVVEDIGPFSAFFEMSPGKYRRPVLVSSTDGVGTKLKIAFMLDKHATVGIDLVAMCVNDILTSGAEPLFFLDYFATGKLSTRKAADVIRGIADGCKQSGCSLIGGETAEMPGFYRKGEYDLAGFCVGMVEKDKVITGHDIMEGDLVIGLASSGLHSNGYSLVRKVFFDIKEVKPGRRIKGLGCTIGEELLKPTRIYVKTILNILKSHRIRGIAHITGGGLTENLPRIIPQGSRLTFVIEKGSWPVQNIFHLVQSEGSVPESEMYKTFNMGIGLALVVKESDSKNIMKKLKKLDEQAYIIGRIEKGRGGVIYV